MTLQQVSDVFKDKITILNEQLKKHARDTLNVNPSSKEYRELLKKEITLLSEKKELIESESRRLEDVI